MSRTCVLDYDLECDESRLIVADDEPSMTVEL